MYLGKRAVIKKMSGRGDVSYMITIPKNVHQMLGFPEEYVVYAECGIMMLVPRKRVVFEETVTYKPESIDKFYRRLTIGARTEIVDIGFLIRRYGLKIAVANRKHGDVVVEYGNGRKSIVADFNDTSFRWFSTILRFYGVDPDEINKVKEKLASMLDKLYGYTVENIDMENKIVIFPVKIQD